MTFAWIEHIQWARGRREDGPIMGNNGVKTSRELRGDAVEVFLQRVFDMLRSGGLHLACDWDCIV